MLNLHTREYFIKLSVANAEKVEFKFMVKLISNNIIIGDLNKHIAFTSQLGTELLL